MNRQQQNLFARKPWVAACLLALGCLPALQAQAGPTDPLQPVQAPMMTTMTVDPNVYWALDDSGSMNYEYTIAQHYRSCVYANFSTSSNASTCSESYYTTAADSPTYNNGSGVSPGNSTSADNRNAVSTGGAYANNSGGRSSIRQVAGYDSTPYWQEWRLRSSAFNVTYFNPEIDYRPWADPDPDIDLYQDSTFTAARSNGNDGITTDLTCYNAWRTSNSGCSGGSRDSLTLDHYTGPHPGTAAARANQVLNGFVFERWIDSHGYNGDRPRRRRAEGAADGGRNNVPNGEIEYWDDHVRYHVRYCDYTNGSAGRWIGNAGGGIPLASIPANNRLWCPSIGYVVEWFYLAHPAQGSGANTQYNIPRIRARGVFHGDQLDNAVGPNGNPVGTGLTANQIAQRAANWYTYYRSRMQLLKSAVGSAVRANPQMRYGMRFMNNNPTPVVSNIPMAGITNYTSHNSTMLQGLYARGATGGTPLVAMTEAAANYLRDDAPMPFTCQHNFIIAFTDGYNNTDDRSSSGTGNYDNDNWTRSLADVARRFYMTDLRAGLANNVAAPRHPNKDADGKTHQHISMFPVSLGLRGLLRDTDGNGWPDRDWNDNAFTPTVEGNWVSGEPSGQTDQRRLDIMWKAAWNSDGKYIAAADARQLVEGIEATLRNILDRTASSSAAAASAGQLTAGLLAFQPNYDAGKWIGRVRAFRFDAVDREFDEIMEYSARLNAQPLASRNILTINSATRTGVAFARANMATEQVGRLIGAGGIGGDIYNDVDAPYPITTGNAAQIAENNAYADDLINWLRGNNNVVSTSPSGMTRNFRVRESRLGDIVNSSPAYVGDNFRYYPHDLEAQSYNTFRQTYRNRAPMLYVGANDGMLHGFKVGDTDGTNITFGLDAGQEKLAYIPNAVYHKLAWLSEPDYSHKYFVDAPISVVEAYADNFPGGAGWRSVLVAGMGGGGQGVFALDVTNPNSFSEANASNVVLWEFGDRASSGTANDGDADIGHVYGQVEVVKLANGRWAAVFGNGYGATESDGSVGTNRAQLFIVDIATGRLIRKIDTGAPGTSFANGLSQPLAVDVDGNYVTDYVYAGDMEGDLWKFDLRSNSPASWSASKVYDGNPDQPIFARPTAVPHPRGGLMVLFGTGRYMITTDNRVAGYPTQAFYGVWDKPGAGTVSGTGSLVQQTISMETRTTAALGSVQVRITSDNPVDYNTQRGWYMPLPQGERVVANPDMILGFGGVASNPLVRFHTYIPSQDPCTPAGDSWTMMLDALSGGRPTSAVYDFNGDGRFDDLDMDYANDGADGLGASGIKNSNGMIGLSGDKLLDDGTAGASSSLCAGLSAETDTGETVDISTTLMCNQRQGRGAWRQLVN